MGREGKGGRETGEEKGEDGGGDGGGQAIGGICFIRVLTHSFKHSFIQEVFLECRLCTQAQCRFPDRSDTVPTQLEFTVR